ncbi:hypothetical protein SpCBS45565_g03932 [Spizellomyces sp. 'palustris']|nr:hypothetical protein SpCBS45565_g03932 [Spizellomyces sp. 'palustris']
MSSSRTSLWGRTLVCHRHLVRQHLSSASTCALRRWSSSQATALAEPCDNSPQHQSKQSSPLPSITTIPSTPRQSNLVDQKVSSIRPPVKAKSSSFPLPVLFDKKASSLAAEIAEYPWLLSISPSRRARPTFWSALRDKHFLTVGTARARKHLNHPTYDFPDQFCEDVSIVTEELFKALSAPDRAGDEESLRTVMVKAVADRFAAGYRTLLSQGKRVEFLLNGKPKITVTGLHFTYGPYPAPTSGYVAQQWWSLIELVIPEEDSTFSSHPRQKEIMQRAMDDGVYFKVDVRVDLDVEFVVTDVKSDMPLIRDRRRRVELQFISPHFSPWDEVFELDAAGEWKLRWQWRISDVDWIVESMMPKVEPKHKIDWRAEKDA